MIYPSVSIIIPTHNSAKVLKICLKAACLQKYPEDKFEVILVDNQSRDDTLTLAKKYRAKLYSIAAIPPQVSRQRNLGTKKASGEYIYILDHDMELPRNFLQQFALKVEETNGKIDAWYVPEIVIAGNKILSDVRSLEKRFYDDTVINAARLIKKSIFKKTHGFDSDLSGGPADWDMDLQLRLLGAKLSTFNKYIYHHEENLPFLKNIIKKGIYIEGSDSYKDKWRKKNAKIYKTVVRKQFSLLYRYFFVFIEDGKWKKLLLPKFHLFLILYFSKILVGLVYVLNKLKK